jgi:murein DD-endopeptidase MepM/ murein hydrolase activator NlpD
VLGCGILIRMPAIRAIPPPRPRAALLGAVPWLIALAMLPPATAAGAVDQPVGRSVARSTGGVTPGGTAPQPTGGTREGDRAPADRDRERRKSRRSSRSRVPKILKFSLGASTLFDEGRPLPVRFRVRSRGPQVNVWLVVARAGGTQLASIDLGLQPTGRDVKSDVAIGRLGLAGEGRYRARIVVRDRRGRRAARAAGVNTWDTFSYASHRFPVSGEFSWGDSGSRFGAGRQGHTHQGQDLSAAEGTPIVAPHAGTVSWISYQAAGAGHYLVLDSAGEDRDYVFMHLQAGSINVRKGQRVPTGKLLGRVGNTGRSFGAHLHFEVWVGGPWQAGGRPIDPLPLLRAWFKSAPGGANTLNDLSEPTGPTGAA